MKAIGRQQSREAVVRQVIMRHIAILAILSSLLLGPVSAHAHGTLDHASPAAGSTVSSSPSQVSLFFTQYIEPMFSRVEVRNAAGARVDQGDTKVRGREMRVSLKALPPGIYSVHWRILSVDTHRTEGSFRFHVEGK
jgi:hypothetical protein